MDKLTEKWETLVCQYQGLMEQVQKKCHYKNPFYAKMMWYWLEAEEKWADAKQTLAQGCQDENLIAIILEKSVIRFDKLCTIYLILKKEYEKMV
jgi:hypothetical protein